MICRFKFKLLSEESLFHPKHQYNTNFTVATDFYVRPTFSIHFGSKKISSFCLNQKQI